jgi:hypothetical protein
MTAKKSLNDQNRGWIPEPFEISSCQQASSKKALIDVRFGVLLLTLAFVGGFLGSADAVLGLGLLSGFGLHVSAVLLVVCIAVAAITVFLRRKKQDGSNI